MCSSIIFFEAIYTFNVLGINLRYLGLIRTLVKNHKYVTFPFKTHPMLTSLKIEGSANGRDDNEDSKELGM